MYPTFATTVFSNSYINDKRKYLILYIFANLIEYGTRKHCKISRKLKLLLSSKITNKCKTEVKKLIFKVIGLTAFHIVVKKIKLFFGS